MEPIVIRTKSYFSRDYGETTVALFREDGCWEVYYSRKGYPLMYAFGLPTGNIGEAFDIAEANIPQYEDMFN